MRTLLIGGLVLSVFSPCQVSAVTIHIPADQPTIQAGIDAAVNGDLVLVSPGTYIENIDFRGKAIAVKSYGDAGRESGELFPGAAMIDANRSGSVVTFSSGETAEAVLEGFIIVNGNADRGAGISCSSSSPAITNCTIYGNISDYGGGIYCDSASPSFESCRIVDNTAFWGGGGIFCENSSSPEIVNCLIAWNVVEYDGAGIYCSSFSSPVITDCTIMGNSAGSFDGEGGAIFCDSASPAIEDCTIHRNSAYIGGGIRTVNLSFPTIQQCSISSNIAEDAGGGIYCASHVTIANSAIEQNSADRGAGIYGSFADVTIVEGSISENGSGGASFHFTDASIVDCTIVANQGRGIYCYESSPEVANCQISGNLGGGIFLTAHSDAMITSCMITDNLAPSVTGGGISCQGPSPTIRNCTISRNGASSGGGIHVDGGAPIIENCTISKNIASYNGGGLAYSQSRVSTIVNCTILENNAGRGGGFYYEFKSEASVLNCTISKNNATSVDASGGGIYCVDRSIVEVVNCIFWEDSGTVGPEIAILDDSSLTVRYSDVLGGEAAAYVDSSSALDWMDGNIEANPLFLGENNYHLRPGSPCIDAGTDVGVYTDMDGQSRPWGAGFDIGADEYSTEPCSTIAASGDQFIVLYLIPALALIIFSRRRLAERGRKNMRSTIRNSSAALLVLAFTLSVHPAFGTTIFVPAQQPTIQAAIDAAVDGDLVSVVPGTYFESIDFLGKAIKVFGQAGAAMTVIDGNQSGSVVSFAGGETEASVIDGFTICNGTGMSIGSGYDSRGGRGGGIYCHASSPIIRNCTISENSVIEFGGGIYCYSSSPTIADCTIEGNLVSGHVSKYGGGIYCDSSSPVIANCTITGNRVESTGGMIYGGGAYFRYSTPIIANCTISKNNGERGGGINCYYSDALIESSTISQNTGDIGAIFIDHSSPTIRDCMIIGNNDTGIYCCSETAPVISNCTIADNNASDDGGAIVCGSSSSPTITNCTITENISGWRGGGLFCANGATPTLINCMINENHAEEGGAIYGRDGVSPIIVNCVVAGNIATDSGGGIKLWDNSSGTITNCTIIGNSAPEGGGINCSAQSSPTVKNCTVALNSAAEGGGLYCNYSDPIITNCILWGNSAPAGSEIWAGIVSYPSTITVSYSDVQGGEAAAWVESGSILNWLDGNIDADPLFAGADDFRLSKGSPCVDAGDPNLSYHDGCIPPALGTERNDMGAYGGPDSCGWCDFDGDGYDDTLYGGEDCDDEDPEIFPGAVEICNGKDDNCDGSLPDDEADADGDGWMPCTGDCDDGDADVNPEMIESKGFGNCDDGKDNDCDGLTDTDPACRGTTIRVPSDQPTIQAGIEAAVHGDLVLVAPGTYWENINFKGKAVTVRSDVDGDPETYDISPETTIIDANNSGIAVLFNRGETEESVLDGLTIRNGNSDRGGGIYTFSSSPTIMNCLITSNSVEESGGGVYCSSSSSPLILDCSITDNRSVHSDGGGMFCSSSSFPEIRNCTIRGNWAQDSGGGIYIDSSDPFIANCTISSNESGFNGGGIYCNSSSPAIMNCLISGNNTGAYGGGICCYDSSPTIMNCTITENRAWSLGPGIFGDIGFGGGIYSNAGSFPKVRNSIVWFNDAEYFPGIFPAAVLVTYSDVQGGWPGTGNIDADPLFVGFGEGHLREGSPCIDTGNPHTLYSDLCIPPSMGTERNDMGAYGGPGACGWLCRDLDRDGYRDESCGGDDCDDTDPLVNPGVLEHILESNCSDGIDNDCDGLIDTDPECGQPCSVIASSKNQLLLYLLPVLAFAFLRRRRMIKK